jgi:ParB-like nuclease family protein
MKKPAPTNGDLGSMKVHCKFDKLELASSLKPHPKNARRHSPEQLKRLAKLLVHHGVRAPIVVSNLSGFIVKGHGTLLACKGNSWKKVPVCYQDFATEDDEYAYLVSDNAIGDWSEFDMGMINLEMPEIGPMDIELLGIEGFVVDPVDKGPEPSAPITLADRFMIPPFTVLNAREGWWQDRKRQWIALGIKSELGRGEATPPGGGAGTSQQIPGRKANNMESGTWCKLKTDHYKQRSAKDQGPRTKEAASGFHRERERERER